MSKNSPLDSCFRWILHFSMLKSSVDLPQLLWLYVLLLHTTLYFYPEANSRLLTVSNIFSVHWGSRIRKLHFLRVYKYRALKISSKFMRTCHNMNIIFQTIGGYASSLNGKSESHNKTLANITRSILLYSSHKKELWCFVYQYAIWISRRLGLSDNSLSDQ